MGRVLLAIHKYRDITQGQNLGDNTAKQQVTKSAASVWPHEDQIALIFPRSIDNWLCRAVRRFRHAGKCYASFFCYFPYQSQIYFTGFLHWKSITFLCCITFRRGIIINGMLIFRSDKNTGNICRNFLRKLDCRLCSYFGKFRPISRDKYFLYMTAFHGKGATCVLPQKSWCRNKLNPYGIIKLQQAVCHCVAWLLIYRMTFRDWIWMCSIISAASMPEAR